MNSEVFKTVNGITKYTFHFTEAFTEMFTFGVDCFEHCGNKEKERILCRKFPNKLWKYFKGIKPNHCRFTFRFASQRTEKVLTAFPRFSGCYLQGSLPSVCEELDLPPTGSGLEPDWCSLGIWERAGFRSLLLRVILDLDLCQRHKPVCLGMHTPNQKGIHKNEGKDLTLCLMII